MAARRPLLFFGGKGGVGKTTMAAATATLLAGRGHRTLLVSTDPAHSTADLLRAPLGNRPAQVAEQLWALEIDSEADADAHVARIAEDAAGTVSREVLPTVEAHLALARQSPGTLESALLDRFVDLMAACPDQWDRIVFDTAPTGHTLRLLALPQLLTAWVGGMARQREKVAGTNRMLRNLAGADEPAAADPVVARLRERRDRLREAGHRLRADAALWLVVVPERLPIEETARALSTLADHNLDVAGLIVNRVLPADPAGPFMRARLADQATRLDEIDRRFSDRRLLRVVHQPHEISDPGGVRVVAAQLRGLLNS